MGNAKLWEHFRLSLELGGSMAFNGQGLRALDALCCGDAHTVKSCPTQNIDSTCTLTSCTCRPLRHSIWASHSSVTSSLLCLVRRCQAFSDTPNPSAPPFLVSCSPRTRSGARGPCCDGSLLVPALCSLAADRLYSLRLPVTARPNMPGEDTPPSWLFSLEIHDHWPQAGPRHCLAIQLPFPSASTLLFF